MLPSGVAGFNAGLLLMDGRVLFQQNDPKGCDNSVLNQWYTLSPGPDGKYDDGAWNGQDAMPSGYGPKYYASAVLPSGKVIVIGGEYNLNDGLTPCLSQTEDSINMGAIFDTTSNPNRWIGIAPPTQPLQGTFGLLHNDWIHVGDAQSAVMPDGTFVLAQLFDQLGTLQTDGTSKNIAVLDTNNLDPANPKWTFLSPANKADANDEEGWTLLPDGSLFTVDVNQAGDEAERALSIQGSIQEWISAGTPPPLVLRSAKEIGPAMLLTDGRVVAFGANGNFGIYIPAASPSDTGTWLKNADGGLFVGTLKDTVRGNVVTFEPADGSAVLLPNGHVLIAASAANPDTYVIGKNWVTDPPTEIFDFDPATNNASPIPSPPNAINDQSFNCRLLLLPSGQVLFTDGGADIELYTPASGASAGVPVIGNGADLSSLSPGPTYSVSGTGFNGLSQAVAYGDDYQAATNYPLVRIVNDSTKHVRYAIVHDVSSMAVASSDPVSAYFEVPPDTETGPSTLYVVANGVPSAAVGTTVVGSAALPTLTALSLSPTNVAGGSTVTITATLSAAAPVGGALIALTSSSAALPVTDITILAGATQGSVAAVAGTVTSLTQVTITADYNGSQETQAGSITSNSSIIALSPSPLIIPAEPVGSSSSQQLAYLTNTGSATVDVNTVTLSGDFAIVYNGCNSINLGPSKTCGFSITFTPTAGGARSGVLTVADDAAGSPQQFVLSSTGTAPAVVLTPTALPDFGIEQLMSRSAVQTVTITNTGNAALYIVSAVANGDFLATNTCSGSVAPSSTCTVSVVFQPMGAGARTGVLTISDNAPDSPQTVSLTGSGAAPTVALAPSPLPAFGGVPVGGNSSAQIVTVSNIGTGPLSMRSIIASGDFQATNTCSLSIAPNTTCAISVVFSPSAAGARTGVLTISDDAPGSPQTLALAGTGTSPEIGLSPSTLPAFGNVPVGTQSAPETLTLTNTGTAPLTVSSAVASGDFLATNTCSGSVAPSSTCTVSTVFQPMGAGARTGVLTISDNAPGSPQTVSLTGTGTAPAIGLSPTALPPFGDVPVGTHSAPETITVTNTGTAPLTVSNAAASGDFQATSTCSGSLAPLGSCLISVTFTPSQSGARGGVLTIADNAPNSPQTVTISGTGTAPEAGLSASTIDLSSESLGIVSPAWTEVITNTGNVALAIASIATTGDFSQTNNCGASVAPSASCTIRVSFTPTQAGARSGTLAINDNAANSPQIVALSGTGNPPVVGLSASALDFSEQFVNGSSTSKTITITDSGTGALLLTSVSATGDFSAVGCQNSIGPNQTCGINVSFTPTVLGSRSGTLTITDNATNSPQTVALSGTGVAVPPPLAPTSLAFSDQPVGTSSGAQSVTLTNIQPSPQNFSGPAVTGDFAASGCQGVAVAPGGTCTVSLVFTPTAPGTRTGTLSFPGISETVSLTGKGSGPASVLSVPTQTFGSGFLGVPSAPQSVTLSNPGTTALAIASIQASGDFSDTSTCGSSLAAGSSCSIAVVFTPTAVGIRSGAITVSDNAPGASQVVALSGDGLALPPSVALAPAALSFASQGTNSTSAAQTVTVSNPGGTALTITSIAASGAFAQSNDCGSSLAAGASCTISVTFTPTVTGPLTGSIAMLDNAVNSPQTIALAGSGIAPGLTLSPSVLNFGSQGLNSTVPLGFNIVNSGGTDLHISGITASGDFAAANSCATIPAGSSCGVTVNFTPTVIGTRSGVISIADDAPGSPQTLSVYGIGIAPGVQLTPPSIQFPDTQQAATSFPISLTLANTGSVAVSGIVVAASGDFQQTNNCGASLAPGDGGPGQSCQISVTFTPRVTGADSGSLTVTDNAGEQQVALVGNGYALGANLSASQLLFGGQLAGTVSGAQTVVLSNTGGAALDISAIAASAGFSDLTSCVAASGTGSLSPGSSCAISVFFAPTASGAQPGTLTVTDSAGTQTVGLNGLGTAAGLQITPASPNFGSEAVNSTGPAQTLTVANTGTAALALNPVAVSGDFLQFNTCPVAPATLAAGGECYVSVSFSPAAAGARSGALSVSDTAGLAATSAVLQGSGTVPGMTAAPAALFFGGAPLAQPSAAQTITVTNTGAAPLTVSAITAQGDFTQSNTCTAAPIPAGQSCVISVAMKPTTAGNETGAIEIYDTADGLHAVALSGFGEAVGVSLQPNQLAFGSQPLPGANSAGIALAGATQSVVLSNSGTAPLALGPIILQGPFTETDNCGASLVAGASCNLAISFAPSLGGEATGLLSFNGGAGAAATATVTLSGFGSPTGLTLTPPAVSFGSQGVGQAGSTQSATLDNQTGQAISGLQIAASGEFTESDNCNGALASGASCVLQVGLDPLTAGTITGSISIVGALGSGSATRPLATRLQPALTQAADSGPVSSGLGEVALVGNGSTSGVGLSATSLVFASQTIGATSAAQTVTLTNSGAAALTSLAVTASGDFATSNACGASLAAGGTCAIAVTFTPSAAGTRTGTLSLADSAADSPQGVALSGLGVAPAPVVTVAPATLTFASQMVGSTSASQSLTLSNTGTAALAITSIAASGDFAQTNTCGTALAAGGTCAIAVTFSPTAAGARSGAIAITDNAAGSPQSVALSGPGGDLAIAAAAGGSTSATVTAGQSATYNLSFTPSGGLTGAFALACTGAPATAACSVAPASLAVQAATAVTATVTVTTVARSLLPPPPPESPARPLPGREFHSLALALAGLLLAAGRLRRRHRRWLLGAGLFAVLALSAACGGGGGGGSPVNSGGGGGAPTGTTAGTYTLTLTATSSAGVARSTPLTLIVN